VLAATAFALKTDKKMKLPICKADGKITRKLQSISPMRLAHMDEQKSPGYGAEQQLVKILYINQDRAVKRNQAMEKKMKPYADKYEVERFTAVKPEEARHKDIKLVSTGHQNAEVNGKKLATYFSHWLVLKHIANMTNHTEHDHKDVYFVLEDDIEFKRKDWIEQTMCHINKLPADWDMYKFGYWEEVSKDRKMSCGLPRAKYETLVDHNQFSCFQQTANVDTQQWMGNQGYAITPAGADHMLKHLMHMPVMDVDGAMMPHGGQRRYAPNNYYSKETILGHDTEVNMATVRNIIS
jgi:GR25 family glycosyltransferase involved in LPS biosynthesis